MSTKDKSPEDILVEYLTRNKKRVTPERLAILNIITNTSEHLKAEAIRTRLAESGMIVSLATVYNTLDLLTKCELVRRHRLEHQSASYERAKGKANHFHLVCTRCGKVKELRNPAFDMKTLPMHFADFAPSYYMMSIYGVCRVCQKRARNVRRKSTSLSGAKTSLSGKKNNN